MNRPDARPAERIDAVLAELGQHWKANPGMSLAEILERVASRLGTSMVQLSDAELMGSLELGVHAVPTDLPTGALRAPGDQWASRPDPLDVIRMHASRKSWHVVRSPRHNSTSALEPVGV
ncbi:hypothetical protein LG293_17015 (plasmid) [Citricoccus nitrophenolicus]